MVGTAAEEVEEAEVAEELELREPAWA